MVRRTPLALALIALASVPTFAQVTQHDTVTIRSIPPAPSSITPRSALLFTAGFASGLVIHESGHLITGTLLNAHPGTKHISYAGIPFFAVTHQPSSPRKEFVISSAGFWMQHLGSEWILSSHRDLRHENAPVLKGIFAFNIATSLLYTGSAILRTGPAERDPRTMAVSLGSRGWPEASMSALILPPALLDAYRYFHPDSRWATWCSRAIKIADVALTLAASSQKGSE